MNSRTAPYLGFHPQHTHTVILTDSVSLIATKGWVGSPDWNVPFENSCGCTTLDMPEWREMTEQIDWRAKQPPQVAFFSEDLKCREAWDTTCGHLAKDITPRREALKEEALDDVPTKDERGPSSVRHWNRCGQRQRWGNFWEIAGWNA